jgi:hypothetical protein
MHHLQCSHLRTHFDLRTLECKFIYLFIFAKMCLRKIALKEKITNLLTDKVITIMVFVQFCDIKNLANFSQKLAKIDEFTL